MPIQCLQDLAAELPRIAEDLPAIRCHSVAADTSLQVLATTLQMEDTGPTAQASLPLLAVQKRSHDCMEGWVLLELVW